MRNVILELSYKNVQHQTYLTVLAFIDGSYLKIGQLFVHKMSISWTSRQKKEEKLSTIVFIKGDRRLSVHPTYVPEDGKKDLVGDRHHWCGLFVLQHI